MRKTTVYLCFAAVLLVGIDSLAQMKSGIVQTCNPCSYGVSAAGFDFSRLDKLGDSGEIANGWEADVVLKLGSLQASSGIASASSLDIVARHAINGLTDHDSIRQALDTLLGSLMACAPLAGYHRSIDAREVYRTPGCYFVRTSESCYAFLMLIEIMAGGLDRFVWYWAMQGDSTTRLYDSQEEPSALLVTVHAFSGQQNPCFVFDNNNDCREIETAFYAALSAHPWPDSVSQFEFEPLLGYRGLSITGLSRPSTAFNSSMQSVMVSQGSIAIEASGGIWLIPDSGRAFENLIINRGIARDLQSSCSFTGGVVFTDVVPTPGNAQQWHCVASLDPSAAGPGAHDICDFALAHDSSGSLDRVLLAVTKQERLLRAEFKDSRTGVATAGTWEQVNVFSGLPSPRFSSVEARNDTVFAGSFDKGVFRSITQGKSWTLEPFSDGLPAPSGTLTSCKASQLLLHGPKLYAVGADEALYETGVDKAAWRIVSLPGNGVQTFVVADKEIVIGTSTGNMYRSIDNGGQWTPMPLVTTQGPWSEGRGGYQLGTIVIQDNFVYLSIPVDCMICSNPAMIHSHLLTYRKASGLWYPVLENLCCRHDLALQQHRNTTYIGHFPYPSSVGIDTAGQFIATLSEAGVVTMLQPDIPDSAWYCMRVLGNDLYVATSAANVYRCALDRAESPSGSKATVYAAPPTGRLKTSAGPQLFDLRGRRMVQRGMAPSSGVYIRTSPVKAHRHQNTFID